MGWFSRKSPAPQADTSPSVPPPAPEPGAETETEAKAEAKADAEAHAEPLAAEPVTREPVSPPVEEPQPSPGPSPQATAYGEYGPKVRITGFDRAPDELTWQLPVRGELYRVMAGPDRPDYSMMLLERPLLFYPSDTFDLTRTGADRLVADRQGRRMVQVHALVLCARFVGQQLHPGMVDLPVNVAYVIDQSVARDATLDLAKIEYAAVGFLSEVGGAATGPASSTTDTVEPDDLIESVGRDVARLLREGISQRRGTAVDRLSATVTIDSAHRISGLTGNADGTPPEPTTETFEGINAALARLASLPPERAVTTLSLHVTGEDVTVMATPRS